MILKDSKAIEDKLLAKMAYATSEYNKAEQDTDERVRAARQHIAFIDAIIAVDSVPEQKAVPVDWLKAAAEDTTYQHAVDRLIDLYEKTQAKAETQTSPQEEATPAYWKIPEGASFRSYGWQCSKCGEIATRVPRGPRKKPTTCRYVYCPFCGAHMTGSETRKANL